MSAVVPETDKIAQQRQLYGESVGALLRIVTEGLGLTQSRVARVLGLSPAMLSQLARCQRVKIGNPLAVARLQALLSLAEEAPGSPSRTSLRDWTKSVSLAPP